MCPEDIFIEVGSDEIPWALWTPPDSSDNSGYVTITSTHDPGAVFPVGNTSVTYTAIDPSGNANICQFYVNVTGMHSTI